MHKPWHTNTEKEIYISSKSLRTCQHQISRTMLWHHRITKAIPSTLSFLIQGGYTCSLQFSSNITHTEMRDHTEHNIICYAKTTAHVNCHFQATSLYIHMAESYLMTKKRCTCEFTAHTHCTALPCRATSSQPEPRTKHLADLT